MKKAISIIICLMAVVLNTNAQIYSRHGGRIGNRMASYANSVYLNSMYHEAVRYSFGHSSASNYYTQYNNSEGSGFWEKQQMGSIGVTFGSIYKGDKSYFNYGIDVVIAGAFLSMTLADTSYNDDYSLKIGWQFGYFIPVCGLGKGKNTRDEKWYTALLISPLIELSSVLNIEGHHLHNTPGHNCHYFVDESYSTKGETGYGAAIMLRFGFGNIIVKMTTTSVGASLGFGG